MSHADQLIEIATEFAMDAKDDVADLRRKLSAIETAKVEIEARLHIANHALERLSSFVSVRGNDLQCPRCWINNEVIANLRPANGGHGDHDKFRCETCKSNFNLQV
jgi:transposase-like protein